MPLLYLYRRGILYRASLAGCNKNKNGYSFFRSTAFKIAFAIKCNFKNPAAVFALVPPWLIFFIPWFCQSWGNRDQKSNAKKLRSMSNKTEIIETKNHNCAPIFFSR